MSAVPPSAAATTTPDPRDQHGASDQRAASVVIVGGGASAVYTAVAIEERAAARGLPAPTVTVIGKEPVVGLGLAYGHAEDHHRLNSPAGKMSITATDDMHFVAWCAERGLDVAPYSFVERHVYGEYVAACFRDLVERSGGRVRSFVDEVVDVQFADSGTPDAGVVVSLANGVSLQADVAVLAIGNPPPATWATQAAVQIDDPWATGALDAIPDGASVLLVGTGLTMVDVATTLARREGRITITATSRHLLVPRAHLPAPAAPGPGLDAEAVSLGELGHALGAQLRQAAADDTPWQAVIDGMRPRLMDHWLGLDEAERRRFLEHLARRWDVHRHRMAPSVHDELQGLVDQGVLRLVRDADPADFDVAVFCTGPASVTTRGWSPLVDALLDAGRIVPEPVGLGLDADPDTAVRDDTGTADGRLLAIGHALRGALWETTAIGEIRILANRVADRALDVLGAREPVAG